MEIIKSGKNTYSSIMNNYSNMNMNININNSNHNNNNTITENDLIENAFQSQTVNQEEEAKKLSTLKETILKHDSDEVLALLESNKYTQKALNIALLTAIGISKSQEKGEIVQTLLSNGANPNIENPKCKRTILMIASANGDIDVINTLLSFKANVNFKDKNNQNCLFHALNSKKGDNVDVVELLISYGADVNVINTNDESPLLIACKENLKNSAKVLIENNANVNVSDKLTGNNTLHYAVETGSLDLVKLLVSKNVNFKAINNETHSALNIALKRSKHAIFNYLNEELQKRNNIDKRNVDEICKDSNKIKSKPKSSILNGTNVVVKKNKSKIEVNANIVNTNTNTKDNNINSNSNNKETGKDNNNNLLSNSNINSINVVSNISNFNNNTNNSNNNGNIVSPNESALKEKIKEKEKEKEKEKTDKLLESKKIMPFKGYRKECKNSLETPEEKESTGKISKIGIYEYIINQEASFEISSNNQKLEIEIEEDKSSEKEVYLKEHYSFIDSVLSVLEYSIIEYQQKLQSLELEINILKKGYKFDSNKLRHHIEEEFSINIDDKVSITNNISNSSTNNWKSNQKPITSLTLKSLNSSTNSNSNTIQKISDLHSNTDNKVNSNNNNSNYNYEDSGIEIIKSISFNDYSNDNSNNNKLRNSLPHLSNNTLPYFNMSKLNKSNYSTAMSLGIVKSNTNNNNNTINNIKSINTDNNDHDNISNFNYACDFEVASFSEESIYTNLTTEIINFKHYNTQQVKLISTSVNSVLDQIKKICSEVLPDYEILVYGSYATSLSLKWSDLDLVLHSKKNMPEPSALKALFTAFTNNNNLVENNVNVKNLIRSCKFIDNTTVPIIKLVSTVEYGSLQVDISLKDFKHYGLKCIRLVNSFLEEYPSLSFLVITLKQILKYADLNDPFKGGISSYGLILMVVFFIQNYRSIYKLSTSSTVNFNNYGKILCEFFDYYGNYFDGSKFFVMVQCKSEFSDRNKFSYNPYMMSNPGIIIVDPMSNQNIVSRSTFKYPQIKFLFSTLSNLIKMGCDCNIPLSYDVVVKKDLTSCYNKLAKLNDENNEVKNNVINKNNSLMDDSKNDKKLSNENKQIDQEIKLSLETNNIPHEHNLLKRLFLISKHIIAEQ